MAFDGCIVNCVNEDVEYSGDLMDDPIDIVFSEPDYDTGSYWDGDHASKLVVPHDGYYHLVANLQLPHGAGYSSHKDAFLIHITGSTDREPTPYGSGDNKYPTYGTQYEYPRERAPVGLSIEWIGWAAEGDEFGLSTCGFPVFGDTSFPMIMDATVHFSIYSIDNPNNMICRVSRNSDFLAPYNYYTAIPWLVEEIDTDNMWSTSNATEIHIVNTGYYYIRAAVKEDYGYGDRHGDNVLAIGKNGSQEYLYSTYGDAGGNQTLWVAYVGYLTSLDHVQAFVKKISDDTGNANWLTDTEKPYMLVKSID